MHTPETHEHLHQTLNTQHWQVNQIEPQQLESLLEGLVNAKVSEHMIVAQERVRLAQENAGHAHEHNACRRIQRRYRTDADARLERRVCESYAEHRACHANAGRLVTAKRMRPQPNHTEIGQLNCLT